MDYSSAGYIPGGDWPTKRERAELILVALASLLVRGGERLSLLGSGIAPLNGRVALTRLVDLIERDGPHSASARAGLPAVEPLPRAAQLVLIGDFLGELEATNRVVGGFAAAGLSGHLLQIVDPAEEELPFDGRVRFEGVEDARRSDRQPGREHPRRLCRAASDGIARGCRRSPARSAGPSAPTAPTGRRIWRCSLCMRRLHPTAGNDRHRGAASNLDPAWPQWREIAAAPGGRLAMTVVVS